MRRADVLTSALDRILDADPVGAGVLVASERAATGDLWFAALESYAAFMAGDFARAARLADHAIASGDPEVRLLGLAARGLASAGWWPGAAAGWTDTAPVVTPTGDPLSEVRDGLAALGSTGTIEIAFLHYVAAEGAIACGRLLLAEDFVGAAGPVAASGSLRFIETILRVRLLAFRGEVTGAAQLLTSIDRGKLSPLASLLLDATGSLVAGNAAQRSATRTLAARWDASAIPPTDHLSRGCRVLVAFGLIAIGELERSARMILTAGEDSDLRALTIVDRGLGLELLVALAAASMDRDAAEAWQEVASPLRGHPISGSAIARLDSRVALMAGRPADAVALGQLAIDLAVAEGRAVEAAEGEIVTNRARLELAASGIAIARLEAVVAEADRSGFKAVRVSAARELRSRGRRLRPLAGAGWAALSPREQNVALLVARGDSNATIGRTLRISDHTVRVHVSRVLAAFGAASRVAIGAALAEQVPPNGIRAALTERQSAVAIRVAGGLGNSAIADDLGISVKTVEKHLADIRARWGVSSRAELARVARATA
ncbi:MAG: helix-turn-helix transcriptional regulator [Pseudolysinimonas sp.]|uniref:helix-turn-helix transcriptional regulator n=1 Tax=Pseudolysinimonas sp. TaxID=2680009 RepID=UPI00326760AD